MRAAELLSEVDTLPYHRRMAALAQHARALPSTPDLPPLLAELVAGDPFQREVALFMATVTRRDGVIVDALDDPDWHVRQVALRSFLRTCPPGGGPILPALLDDAPADSRQRVYRLVRLYRREDLADALIDRVRARFGDGEAGRLLPMCTASAVERLLPNLWHALRGWSALAHRHPAALLREAERQLSTLPASARGPWWSHFGSPVLACGAALPAELLTLLERHAPATYLPGDLEDYGVLAQADPLRVRDLLTAPDRATWSSGLRLPRALLTRLARLTPAELAPLARPIRGNELALVRLLDAVPPRHREELFNLAQSDVDSAQAIHGDPLLHALPRARRVAEARRILRLARVRDHEDLTLRFTSYLPWEEAESALFKATCRADANDRAAGYEWLLACADHSGQPAIVTLAARQLLRVRNEQDPVRARALNALARVRPSLFEPAVAEVLERLTTDAVEARDGSHLTVDALGTLAVTLLREHHGEPALVGWATGTLERLFGGDRMPNLGPLTLRLRRGQEVKLFGAVHDWVAAGARRGRYAALLAVARGLDKRAWRLPELQDMLRDAIDRATDSVAQAAIDLWLAAPATRSARVEDVLRAEPSAVGLHRIWATISNRRTDLLDSMLVGPPPTGRFLPKDVRWVPSHVQNIRRWLPRQQRAYADLLAVLAADEAATVHTRVRAIADAARIPHVGWDFVTAYLGSTSVNLVEAALGALPWTDRPVDALPILLSHVDDDRARVAVYAASRASRYVPPSMLGPALVDGPLTHGKVTARKEAVRLLAALGAPGAAEILLATWQRNGEHRDVRAAVVSAARQRHDDPRLWPILTEAATGSREEALALFHGGPYGIAERRRAQYAELVVRACQSTDVTVARAAWQAFPAWSPWTPDAAAFVLARLVDLDDHRVWLSVVPAVVTLVGAHPTAGLLESLVGALADLDDEDPTRGDPERDRPARRRLEALVNALGTRATTWPNAYREPLRSAGLALAAWPSFAPQAATLLTLAATTLVHTDNPELVASTLDEACRLLAERPVVAAGVATALTHRLRGQKGYTVDSVRAAGALLAARADVPSGLFAVALATQGAAVGWPEPWRALVHRLREHPNADVRAAALDIKLDSNRVS